MVSKQPTQAPLGPQAPAFHACFGLRSDAAGWQRACQL